MNNIITKITRVIVATALLVCEKYINGAENLGREADEMAKYHEMRAKEVEGK